MQKNFALAIGLIVSFLLLWTMFVVPRFTPPSQPVTSTTPNASLKDPETQPSISHTIAASKEKAVPAKFSDATLKDENNEIVLTSKGGAIKHWIVKSKGQDVDLVLDPENDVLPLATFADTAFTIHVKDRKAIMQGTLSNGIHVTKTLSLQPTGHLHTLSYQFQNPTAQPIELTNWILGWGPGLGTAADEVKENPGNIRALTLGKLKIHPIKPGAPVEGGKWTGLDNRYFLVAFVPKIAHPTQTQSIGTKAQTQVQILETTKLPAKSGATLDYELYVGPKGYTALKAYDRGLEESVDFGMFTSLGRLILSTLNYLKTMTGNYGFAIIILTIGLQLLMFPLTVKSFKATLSMKKLQPKIAELQARYKGDPKRLNVEMMNLYKSTGTNPFGGCLPMLLQLPIFWALFTTLRNAYELRGAPFIGWIHNLSAPDVLFQIAQFPVHALPLLMGIAMFFQQRMSGAVSDPTQKQMMTMMPIMFTFMFYGFPAGLVLYWLTNNLMTMAIQWTFQKLNQEPSPVIETTIVK